jgi:hypothetical protein
MLNAKPKPIPFFTFKKSNAAAIPKPQEGCLCFEDFAEEPSKLFQFFDIERSNVGR